MSPPQPVDVEARQQDEEDASQPVSQPTVAFALPTIGTKETCTSLDIMWYFNGPQLTENAIALWLTNKDLFDPTTFSTSPSATSAPPTTQSNTQTSISEEGFVTIPEGTGNPTTAFSLRALPTNAAFPVQNPADIITVPVYRSSLRPTDGQFTLRQITVPPGLYVVAASFPDSQWTYTQRSLPFRVALGNDTSCIGSIPTTVLATGTPTPDASSAASASGASSSNKGAIAGGIVGALAALAALAAALLCYRYKQLRVTRIIRNRRLTSHNYPRGSAGPWARLDDDPNGNYTYTGGVGYGADRKPPIRSYGTDVKSPTAFNFGSAPSPVTASSPGAENENVVMSPTFIRAPQPARNPFAESPHHQSSRSLDNGFMGTTRADNSYDDGAALPTPSSARDPVYPSGGSGVLPTEDLAAIWANNRRQGQNNSASSSRSESPDHSLNSSTGNLSAKTSSLRRKPVPNYGMNAKDDDVSAPKKSASPSPSPSSVSLDRIPTGDRNIIGKEMHYIVPDPPTFDMSSGK